MKKWSKLLGVICYALGVFFSLYVGGYLMLIKPVRELIYAFSADSLTFSLLIYNIIVIALSTTFAGFVWCIGYIGYNFFKGTDDPDWEAMEQAWQQKKLEKENKEEKKRGKEN